jgi:hypothetical protein
MKSQHVGFIPALRDLVFRIWCFVFRYVRLFHFVRPPNTKHQIQNTLVKRLLL